MGAVQSRHLAGGDEAERARRGNAERRHRLLAEELAHTRAQHRAPVRATAVRRPPSALELHLLAPHLPDGDRSPFAALAAVPPSEARAVDSSPARELGGQRAGEEAKELVALTRGWAEAKRLRHGRRVGHQRGRGRRHRGTYARVVRTLDLTARERAQLGWFRPEVVEDAAGIAGREQRQPRGEAGRCSELCSHHSRACSW